jgi:dienelactone hydrolase
MQPYATTPLERLDLKNSSGDDFFAWVHKPAGKMGAHAVVLLPAIAGINPYVQEIACQLGAAGYSVVVIDYFSHRTSIPDLSTPERIGAAVAALDDRVVLEEVDCVMQWLDSHGIANDRIGILGLCIGGTYAVLAGERERAPGCAVAYYGQLEYEAQTAFKPRDPMTAARHMRTPLLGHFGDMDRLISPEQVASFSKLLAISGKAHEVRIYQGAPHAFDEWFRPQVYRPVASAEAWRRTLIFLDWHLRKRALDRRNPSLVPTRILETLT